MKRTEGWRKRLASYVSACRSTPYELGTFDCWLFVAGAIEAMTGKDLGLVQRGRYKTQRGALGVMKRDGAVDMAEFAEHRLTALPDPVMAQVGDVMAIPTDDAFGFALGILNGERILVVTPKGIDTRDRAEATRAFKV